MRFANQTVLVTGAAGNLGRAVAQAFLAEGARVVLCDISTAALDASWPGQDARIVKVAVNLLDADAVGAATQQVLAQTGRIDVLANIAGGFRMGPPVHETPAATWDLMMDLNAKTVLNTARAVVPGMLAAKRGKVVNVAAAAGQAGRGAMGAYCASKAAVIRITESMAAELRESGINVNCVMPTIIDTPVNRADMPDAEPSRWVAPEALADVILFLASDAARAVHGAALPVSGLS